MSLLISDLLINSGQYDVIWAIPGEGILSQELLRKGYKFYFLGDLMLPAGTKGKKVILKYCAMSIRAITKILSIISREKIDIIYAPGPASIPWSAICGRMKKKPVIWHLHHNFTDGPTKKLINSCSKFKSVDMIIAVSKTVGNQILVNDKVRVIYNPVDFEKYNGGNADKLKMDYPFNTGSTIICQVALLEEEKRQESTVRILSELIKLGKDYRAIFVGAVKPGDEQYLSKIKEIANELGVEDRCCFLGYRNDIPDLLKASDIAIIPSMEGFPLAGLEAYAAGIPVLACDIGGAAELVEIANCGKKYHEGDYQAGAELAIKAIRENDMQNGIAFAKECSISSFSEKIIGVFNSIVFEKNKKNEKTH